MFSFKGPEVAGLEPSYSFDILPALDGSGPAIEFNVSGIGFGHESAAVARVSVGGEPCAGVEWLSSSLLRCTGIRMTQWSSSNVEVALVSNQSSSAPLLHRYGAPRVTVVQPGTSGVAGGQRQSILCADCGEVRDDVLGVTIGGHACTNVSVEVSQGQG